MAGGVMSALAQLGEFVATYRADDATRAKIRLHVADTLGAWIAATGTDEGRALIRYGRADSLLAGQLATNCALARLSEVDDIHLAAMITPGAIVIPAALTIAAHLPNEESDDLAAAIVVGYEAMIRLGVAIDGPSVLYRGIWPSYFAAPFGAAAVHARLAKLDPKQTAHALALALIVAAPGVGHHTAATTARWLAIGQAAARGWEAARAAQAGFTSDLAIADGDFLKNVLGLTPNVRALSEGFGKPALMEVSFKPWCAARQTMAATQGLKEIMAEGVSAEAIREVEAAVLPPHLKMINHGVAAGDRFSFLTSAQFQMATAALRPDAAYELSGSKIALPPELQSFMARIKLVVDESLLNAGYPKSWPARVTVVSSAGRHARLVSHVPGDPERPLSASDLRQNFSRIVAPILGYDSADEMYARGLGALDQPPTALVRDIAKIAVRSIGSRNGS